MLPIIKYQGGKRRELPLIRPYLTGGRIIEPFVGGAAVSLDIGTPALVSDMNPSLINLYKVVGSSAYGQLQSLIDGYKLLTGEYLEEAFYAARDVINNPQDELVWAASFIMVRQQCFSGMERYNRAGKYNVPHGRYKTFSCCLNDEHHEYLKHTPLTNMNAIDFIKSLDDETFLFLDPPYLDRAGYETKDGGIHLHAELSILLNTTVKNPWLIVHSDHPFYREAYRNFNIKEVPFKYAQQFNGGDYNSSVNHLYISNF